MSFFPAKPKFRMNFTRVQKIFHNNMGWSSNDRPGNFGIGLVALKRAAIRGERSVVRIQGVAVAILPLRDPRRLERLLEQEEEERKLDRLDVEEAERRLSDPSEVPIPLEQALRDYGVVDVSD